MTSRILSILLMTIALAGTVYAQRLPSHYPESFQRTGTVDDARDDVVVINDVPYTLSDSVVVHSLSASNVSVARVRRGAQIGYRTGQNRQIVEIWLLPSNYDHSKSRR